MKRFAILAIISLLIVLFLAPFMVAKSGTVDIQILAINDFHGNLEPDNLKFSLSKNVQVPAGGIE